MADEGTRAAALPAWRWIANVLAGEIRAGRWPAGGRLPSAVGLAQRFGVHRHTVRQALARLREQGLLEATTVPRVAAVGRLPVPLAACADLSAHLRQMGLSAACDRLADDLVSTLPPPLSERAPAGGMPRPLLRLRYRVIAEGSPIAHTEAFVPATRGAGLLVQMRRGRALGAAMRQCGAPEVKIRRVWVEARASGAGAAKVLPTRSLLQVCILALDERGRALKLCVYTFDADRVSLVF